MKELKDSRIWMFVKRVVVWSTTVLVALTQLFAVMPAQVARAASTSIVLSQVQTAGATAADEFVELYNPTNAPVALSSWSLQYRGGAASGFDKQNLSKSIPAHGYFLLANASGAFAGQADQTWSNSNIALSATGGTVFLVNNQTVLPTATDTSIVDRVAYGTGTLFPEGPFAVAAPSAGNSIVRLPNTSNGNGHDTDTNFVDFQALSPSSARNTTSLSQPIVLTVPTLSLVAGDGTITANWNGVASATSYDINITPAGTAFANPDASVGSLTQSKVFDGLTNATAYTVRLRAVRSSDASDYASANATPVASVVVQPDALAASIAYYPTGSNTAAAVFGVGTMRAEVTLANGALLNAGQNPTITFARPNSQPVTKGLVFDAAKHIWVTGSDFTVAPSNGNQASIQDGTVQSTLAATGKSFNIVSGGSFAVDTTVAKPVAQVKSACSPSQDVVAATTDSDVTYGYLYRSASLDQNSLIAVSPVSNGHMNDVMIGDNMIGSVWLVAQDALGNRSEAVQVVNDVTAPAVPQLQVEGRDGTLHVSWPPVADASSYVLRWQKIGDSTVGQQNSSESSADIPVDNGVAYQVSMASRDAACNMSAFNTVTGIGMTASAAATAGRGGMADDGISVATHEKQVLDQVMGQTIMVAATKDGQANVALNLQQKAEQEKKIAEQKAAEEKAAKQKADEQKKQEQSKVNDRSRLILGIAIALIIAGTAIAAYSWYQGGEKAASSTAPLAPEKKSEAASAKDSAKDSGKEADKEVAGQKKRPGGKRKKTRW